MRILSPHQHRHADAAMPEAALEMRALETIIMGAAVWMDMLLGFRSGGSSSNCPLG